MERQHWTGPAHVEGADKLLKLTLDLGEPMLLEGRVLDTKCRPVPGAVLDFWSCDGEGEYDNDGMRLRGHQFADDEGRYRIETSRF